MSILVCSTLYLTSTKKSGFQPPENGQTTEEVNCVPHYDPGLFSISILSTHKGLQLKNMTNNEWVDGPLEPNIGVIWLGKAASRITQNRLKPGIHRVIYPQKWKSRLTIWYEVCTTEQLKNISADKKDELMADGAVTFASMPGSAPITVIDLKNISADKKDELMTNGAVAFASMPGSAPITVLPGETKLEFLKRVEMAYHGLSMSKLGPSYYVLEKHTISYPTNSLKTE
ncbi:unnamed protein product [Rotaria sp. Silwood1]|nr:unnamed protein product [Rotaria sp. Silwood1]